MAGKIKCKDCAFARADRKASERDWTAYECGNRGSEYYKALLNVTPKGEKQASISWRGCAEGRAR